MAENDKYLFESIRSGNRNAFEKVFRMFYRDLCRYAVFMSLKHEEAEDIVQDLFFRIWQNRKDLIITSSLKSYLYASVKNSILNKIKHENIKSKYIQYKINNEELFENSEIIENNELKDKIESVINDLPEKRREIFILSKIDGLKYKEIAEKLNISVKTVENQMGEALKFLRNNLSGENFITVLLISAFLAKNTFIMGVFKNLIVLT